MNLLEYIKTNLHIERARRKFILCSHFMTMLSSENKNKLSFFFYFLFNALVLKRTIRYQKRVQNKLFNVVRKPFNIN